METENRDEVMEEVRGAQYLTFVLDEEIYGIEISRIKEVLEVIQITRIPGAPDFMKGVINLRGGIVPVADLRSRFAMPFKENTVDTCIIIVEVLLEGDYLMMGAVADSVREVVDIDENSIEPPPAIGKGENTPFLRGMGRHGDDFCILLDIDRLFGDLVEEIEEGTGSGF